MMSIDKKLFFWIVVTDDGITISFNDEHPQKKIVVINDWIDISSNNEHSLKSHGSIAFSDDGIAIFVNNEISSKP